MREIRDRSLFLETVSSTFHGRDVFAPVAAALAGGLPPARLGPRVKALKRLPFPEPRRTPHGWRGMVMAVDRFGDAVTNLPSAGLPPATRFACGGARARGVSPSYAAVPVGREAALAGSFGFVELAGRDGSFAAIHRVRPGDAVEATLPSRAGRRGR